MDEIRVFSPATVANVVCGFDCLGFALESPNDLMTLKKSDVRGITIVHRDSFGLTTDPRKNVAGVALQALIDAVGLDHGFEMEITKQIKPGSGIGSSAASACGAVFAANQLIGDRFTKSQLVELAMEGEIVASGSRHADNLAPCIYGGFTLVRSTDPLDIVEVDFPPLFVTVIHPQIEIRTSEARAILPKQVPLMDAVRNWSNLGSFVAAMAKGDLDLMSRSMEDTIVEPARKSLIPKFDEIKLASRDVGAIGGGISGSGPSIFMLSASAEVASNVETVMKSAYSDTGVSFNTYTSSISATGVTAV